MRGTEIMSKGTRSVGRLAAMIAPVLAAAITASCGGGAIRASSTRGAAATSTGTGGAGAGGAGGNNVGGNTTATSTASSASTGVVDPSCVMDADCVNDPKGKVCDPQTGQCVACLPTNDVCPQSE